MEGFILKHETSEVFTIPEVPIFHSITVQCHIFCRFQADRVNYEELFDDPDTDGGVALGRISGTVPRKENHIVAQINGETLQAICLRYNCSVGVNDCARSL